MKKNYSPRPLNVRALCFAVSFIMLFIPWTSANAQSALDLSSTPIPFKCDVLHSSTAGDRTMITGYAPYGNDLTMAGDLRVLVIFAGFTEDLDPVAPNYNDPSWPQFDQFHAPGTTFPVNYDKAFYSDFSQFNAQATDKTISNFYYQMSRNRPSMQPFRMIAEYFPDRINIPGDNNFWTTCNSKVMQAIENNPLYRNYAWNNVDNRQNNPDYQVDTSVLPSDHKVDYVIIVWRSNGRDAPFGSYAPTSGGAFSTLGDYNSPGSNPPPFFTFTPNGSNTPYSIAEGFTHCNGMAGINTSIFIHEFAHGVFDAQHVYGNNGVVGNYFTTGTGITMMNQDWNFMYTANAWEKWYNGWIDLKSGPLGSSSDIQSSADLTATNGIFTLRDIMKTGDAIRIRIPNTYDPSLGRYQSLWLENHADARIPFNTRFDWPIGGDGGALLQPSLGMYAFVEKMRSSRNEVEGFFGGSGTNGFKTLAASGQFDYIHDNNPGYFGNHLWDNWLANYTSRVSNPTSAHNEVAYVRDDWDFSKHAPKPLDGVIDYNPDINNTGGGNEFKPILRLDGSFVDGQFGPTVGFKTAGQKLGISSNPMIVPLQEYDQIAHQLAPIDLNGLSVEILSVATNGDITLKVRYDDVDIANDTRWTGNLRVNDVPTAANGYDINIKAGQTLTVNKSGSANRHTKTTANDFINPTIISCEPGSTVHLESGAVVRLQGAGTTFRVKSGAQLLLESGASFIVETGATLDIDDNALCALVAGSTLRVETGGKVVIHNTVAAKGLIAGANTNLQVSGNGQIIVDAGAYLVLADANASTGLQLEGTNSELLVRGQLRTAANVNLSFHGRGFISFEGIGASVALGTNSQLIQSGQGRTDVLYAFRQGAHLTMNPNGVQLTDGLLTYASQSSLTFASPTTQTFTRVSFAGPGPTGTDNFALRTQQSSGFNLIDCEVAGFVNGVSVASNTGPVQFVASTIHNCLESGVILQESGQAVIDATTIEACGTGITASNTNVTLRNKAILQNNTYGFMGTFPATSPGTLTVGDQGCGWIINNRNDGVGGTNVLLDIDATTHRGSNLAYQTNRFDGNGGYSFSICYGSTVPAGTLGARGNYWGGAQPSQYSYNLRSYCDNHLPTYYTLNASGYATQAPVACSDFTSVGIGPAPEQRGTEPKVEGASRQLTLYPNPAERLLQFEISNDDKTEYLYELVNIYGQIVRTGKCKGERMQLAVEAVPRGTYVLRLRSNSGKDRFTKTVQLR